MSSSAPLLSRVEALLPAMGERAAALDAAAAFPAEDVDSLRAAGVLAAPIPAALGGLGLGTEPDGAAAALALLRLLGRGSLALGRLIEAHVNAARLVFRYGGEALRRQAADDLRHGHLLGLWVTDPAGGGLHLQDGRLHGAKQFCSGAGHASRAVVTAERGGATWLAYAATDNIRAERLPQSLAGMRAATTGQVQLSGAAGETFGAAGDYLREPDFSCGAWRTSAVTAGGIQALAAQTRNQLQARGRAADPHQLARIGQGIVAAETAWLWVREAASRAEAVDAGDGAIAYVGLARIAVERAGLDVIELAQRSLGVAALQLGNPAERIARDLATYLRQPAADMVLAEAAAWAGWR